MRKVKIGDSIEYRMHGYYLLHSGCASCKAYSLKILKTKGYSNITTVNLYKKEFFHFINYFDLKGSFPHINFNKDNYTIFYDSKVGDFIQIYGRDKIGKPIASHEVVV